MSNALRISGEQDVLKLATRSGRYPITMLCWARIVTDRNTYSAILTVEYGVEHSTEYNELVTDSDGTTLVMCDHGSLWATVGTMGVGTWRKVAMVITAGHVDCYFGTEGTAGVTRTVNASITNITSVDYQGVGASNYASAEWFNGRLSGVRVWNAALTEAEIEAEFTSATPVRSADLLGAWLPPTVTVGTVLTAIAGADLVDGNGGGTPDYTVEEGPTLDAATSFIGSGTPTVSLSASGTGSYTAAANNGTGTPSVAPTASGSGLESLSATGAASATPAASGAAYERFSGTGTASTSPASTGSGTQSATGSGSAQCAPSATGAGSESVTGSGSASAYAASSGSGLEFVLGAGSATASAVAAGVGTYAGSEGSGSASASVASAGSGYESLVATGHGDTAVAAVGSGLQSISGTGSPQGQTSATTGSGVFGLLGIGAAAAVLLAVGAGGESASGAGVAVLSASAAGAAYESVSGSGATQLAPASTGAGVFAPPGGEGYGHGDVSLSAVGSGYESVVGSGSPGVGALASGDGGITSWIGAGSPSAAAASSGEGFVGISGSGAPPVVAVAASVASYGLFAGGDPSASPSSTGVGYSLAPGETLEGAGSPVVEAVATGHGSVTDSRSPLFVAHYQLTLRDPEFRVPLRWSERT